MEEKKVVPENVLRAAMAAVGLDFDKQYTLRSKTVALLKATVGLEVTEESVKEAAERLLEKAPEFGLTERKARVVFANPKTGDLFCSDDRPAKWSDLTISWLEYFAKGEAVTDEMIDQFAKALEAIYARVENKPEEKCNICSGARAHSFLPHGVNVVKMRWSDTKPAKILAVEVKKHERPPLTGTPVRTGNFYQETPDGPWFAACDHQRNILAKPVFKRDEKGHLVRGEDGRLVVEAPGVRFTDRAGMERALAAKSAAAEADAKRNKAREGATLNKAGRINDREWRKGGRR